MDNVNWELSDTTGGNVNLYNTEEHGVISGEFQQFQLGIAPKGSLTLGYMCKDLHL